MTRANTWSLAVLLAIVLSVSWQLDEPADTSTDAQRQAAADARKERAARDLCRQQYGEAGFRWTADGSLVCTTKHGRVHRAPSGLAIVNEVR